MLKIVKIILVISTKVSHIPLINQIQGLMGDIGKYFTAMILLLHAIFYTDYLFWFHSIYRA